MLPLYPESDFLNHHEDNSHNPRLIFRPFADLEPQCFVVFRLFKSGITQDRVLYLIMTPRKGCDSSPRTTALELGEAVYCASLTLEGIDVV